MSCEIFSDTCAFCRPSKQENKTDYFVALCKCITHLPEYLPKEIRVISCVSCPNLSSVTLISNSVRILSVSKCNKLILIPSLQNLETILCSDCPALKSIAIQPILKRLSIDSCPKLTSLPELPNLENLELGLYPELKSWPCFPKLKSYTTNCICFDGVELIPVPMVSSLTILNCFLSSKLLLIPTVTNLLDLNCSNCVELKSIPYFPNLKALICNKCDKLEIIPLLPNLEKLTCCNCTRLNSVFKYENKNINYSKTVITELDCSYCILLTEVPYSMECLETFHYDYCPLLHCSLNAQMKLRNRAEFFRNGVSPRDIKVMFSIKNLYVSELPSRVAMEVEKTAYLYAPGGAKYLELVEQYRHGIVLGKRQSSK